MHKHKLQILHKKQFFKKKRTFPLTKLILHHTIQENIHDIQENKILETKITTHNYPSNASNKKNKHTNTLSIDITLEPLDFSDLPHITIT